MSRSGVLVVVGAAAAILAACAGDEQQEPREKPKAFHPPVEILERYDLDHDGTLTRAEMEKGLRVEFDAADRKHTGCLDADETAAVNESRWAEGLSTTSTIVDWNHD
ncbi:MAG: hypothetical protein JO261_03475, partial [Alphaproteobacteria bacterium]|nr:hypothetical protein [Alphaproteobacteria bacterium]